MKKSMDKDTILFTRTNQGGLGFNINFYRTNYDQFSNVVNDPQDIFYKMGETSDSWIDYRRAIQTKTGSIRERLEKAYQDPAYHITDLRDIPETKYYDVQGYQHTISPFDGEFNTTYWLERTIFNLDAIQYEFKDDDLIVKFSDKDNISNAMISLNSFFYHYEILNYHTILFRNIKPLLPKVQILEDSYDGIATRIQVYAWNNLLKKQPVFPIRRENEWFTLERPIEENCFIIYHGIMYEYELNYTDKTKFKLLNVNPSSLELFKLDDIFVYKMEHEQANKAARKFIATGIGNKYKNTVEFTLPIENSVVTFNGVDNEFEIIDVATIYYPRSLFSVTHISTLSFIKQVNFMLGM